MSQTNFLQLSNEAGLPFRLHLNELLGAIGTGFSGPTPPPTTAAEMIWVDTSSGTPALKRRNATNTAWEDLGVTLGTLSAPTGAALIGCQQTGSTSTRTTQSKLRDFVNVLDFGADPTGAVDCTSSFQAAGNQSPVVHVTKGTYRVDTQPTFSTPVTFIVHADAVLTGSGGINMGYTTTKNEQYLQVKTSPSDYGSLCVRRNAFHTGGTAGYVSTGIRADTFVGPDATNYEWAILGKVYNQANAGENVGIFGQGIKAAIGPTWAAVFEAIDVTDSSNPTKGLVGIEVDVRANGNDLYKNRVGIDMVITKQNVGGSDCVSAYGYRTSNGMGDTTSYYQSSFAVISKSVVGFDTAEGTLTSAAFRMAQGQSFAFDAGMQHTITYDGVGIQYKVGGVLKSRLNADGGIILNGGTTEVSGSFTTGTQTPSLGANKPGSSSGAPSTWLSVKIDGGQYWIPAWAN